MRLLSAGLLLLGLGAPASAVRERDWHETLSPQLHILHQAAFLPRSFLMDVGRTHSRLKLDLSMFSPWMSKDRIKVYLYADRESYLRGEFHPPAWSNGIAYFDRRSIATFVQEGGRRTTDVISHEMTHVLFESYWAEVGKPPPVWLNEGLAMLEEARDPSRPEDSDWYQSMALLSGRALPMARFVAIKPVEDAEGLKMDKDDVTLWYVQAYSTIHFLYRRHTRLQFFQLVKGLRDGKTLTEMLWQVYRYRTLDDFETAWRVWLKMPAVQDRFAAGPGRRAGSASPDPVSGRPPWKLKAASFEGMGFKSLAPDGKR